MLTESIFKRQKRTIKCDILNNTIPYGDTIVSVVGSISSSCLTDLIGTILLLLSLMIIWPSCDQQSFNFLFFVARRALQSKYCLFLVRSSDINTLLKSMLSIIVGDSPSELAGCRGSLSGCTGRSDSESWGRVRSFAGIAVGARPAATPSVQGRSGCLPPGRSTDFALKTASLGP